MDVLKQVRELNAGVGLTETQVAAARMRMLEGIEAKSVAACTRVRPMFVIAGVVATAAAATAAVLVVNQVTPAPQIEAGVLPTVTPLPTGTPSSMPSPTPTPTPSLTPAVVFRSAANVAAGSATLRPGPGQFLRIKTRTEQILFDDELAWGQYSVDRLNADSAWTVANTTIGFAPYDQAGDWTFDSGSSAIVATYGDAEAGIEQWRRDSGGPSTPNRLVLPGGPMPPWAGTDGESTMVSFLASMPTDPAALIDWIAANQGDGEPGKVGWLLIDVLASNAGTAQQRSVMYNALALLNETEIVAQHGDVVVIAFHRPYYGEDSSQVIEHTVTIDLATSLVLEKTERRGAGSALVPDSVPDSVWTYTLSVVDAID